MKHSFKTRLMIAFLLIGILPLIVISTIYQYVMNDKIIKYTEASSIETLRYMSLNVERILETSDQLLGWITYNQRLENILKKEYKNEYEKQLDIIKFNEYVTEYAINSNVESSIFKILILQDDGTSFQMGNGYSLIDKDAVVEAQWIERFHGKKAEQLVLSKDVYVKDTYVFPVVSRIYNNINGKPAGWCLILFRNDMYSKHIMTGEKNENLLMMNEEGQCISHKNPELIGQHLNDSPLVQSILDSENEWGHVKGEYDGKPMICHYYRVPSSNLIGIQMTSLENFYQEKREMTRIAAIFILGVLVLTLIVIFYLRNKLVRPIERISEYIKGVAGNGFQGNLILEGDDELKKIADSINTMELEIKNLMEDQRREAEIKKELEFKVLQNQINPHFLYNTLNCIKWMATLQHAHTIRDMTAALGRLLQNIAKGTETMISIYEEMSLVDDYVMIQDIKYDGKIRVEYHIGDSDITQAYIIKFLLQPIVENAIFHGIEPKDGCGRIDIYLKRQEKDICIDVVDDGIGMTQDQIESLLQIGDGNRNSRGLSGVGISNIQERIKMTYGEEYGLTIRSELGKYTAVMIRIPYKKEG